MTTITERSFISLFTPSRTQPEDLEAILVQRHELLNDTVERVRESAITENKHHLLFVGPRGTGKTHLITLLVHRLGQKKKLDKRLHIAWLNEDKTNTTVLDLLHHIYLALNKRYPDEYDKESLESMFDMEADTAKRYLINLLLKRLQKRTLLVIMENLDALFDSLQESGQQDLRAFIQEHPVLSIIATAQKLTDDISKRKSTFFGFFQTEHLKTLSIDEATELLSNIAQLDKQTDVVEFLRSAAGRARIRALYHLSGGNHRVYIALSKFISHDSINTLVDLFAKMIDKMTPYYQERIRWLAPQQRKIIEYLCTCEHPATVKKIARQLFTSSQSISSQLKELREKGYVVAAQRGRESLYEIAEPLMRLCVEVKENQSNEPLRMLVDFLRVWYDGQELTSRLEGCKTSSVEQAYLKAAIEKNTEHGNLRKLLLVEGFRAELSSNHDQRWSLEIETLVEESEVLALAYGLWTKGDDSQAISILEEIMKGKGNHNDHITVLAGFLSSDIYLKKDSLALAIKSLDFIIKLEDAPVEFVAKALLNRGVTYNTLGDNAKELADYSTLIKLEDAPVEFVANALLYRGVTFSTLGDTAKSLDDLSTLIKLKGAPVDKVAIALLCRGVSYSTLDDTARKLADYNTLIEMEDAPVNQVAYALFFRGITYSSLDDTENELADYSTLIKLENAPVEQVAKALCYRGMTYSKLEDTAKAIADYNTLFNLEDAPAEQVAKALLGRGIAYWNIKEKKKSEKDFKTVLQRNDTSVLLQVHAQFNLVEIFVSDGRWDAAMIMLDNGLSTERELDESTPSTDSDFIHHFFESSQTNKIRNERIFTLVNIYQDNDAISQLGKLLVRHLGVLYSQGEGIPPSDNLESWATNWEAALENISASRVPQRIFRTGINFLKSGGKDRGILLDLNQDERMILEQALGFTDEP